MQLPVSGPSPAPWKSWLLENLRLGPFGDALSIDNKSIAAGDRRCLRSSGE